MNLYFFCSILGNIRKLSNDRSLILAGYKMVEKLLVVFLIISCCYFCLMRGKFCIGSSYLWWEHTWCGQYGIFNEGRCSESFNLQQQKRVLSWYNYLCYFLLDYWILLTVSFYSCYSFYLFIVWILLWLLKYNNLFPNLLFLFVLFSISPMIYALIRLHPPSFGSTQNLEALAIKSDRHHDSYTDNDVNTTSVFSR